MNEEPPGNIIAINPEVAKDIEIRRKQSIALKCSGHHKSIVVDPVERVVKCRTCGFAVDPFDYLLDWANDVERRLTGLQHIEIQRKIAQAEHDDLMRKISNLRARLKRKGFPQPEVERQEYNRQRWNPSTLPHTAL